MAIGKLLPWAFSRLGYARGCVSFPFFFVCKLQLTFSIRVSFRYSAVVSQSHTPQVLLQTPAAPARRHTWLLRCHRLCYQPRCATFCSLRAVDFSAPSPVTQPLPRAPPLWQPASLLCLRVWLFCLFIHIVLGDSECQRTCEVLEDNA